MKYEPMPSLLTSRGFNVGVAVVTVLLGVFALATAAMFRHRATHIALGLLLIANGGLWVIRLLPRKKTSR
jgi:cytochrome c biogenesis protein CcdA